MDQQHYLVVGFPDHPGMELTTFVAPAAPAAAAAAAAPARACPSRALAATRPSTQGAVAEADCFYEWTDLVEVFQKPLNKHSEN